MLAHSQQAGKLAPLGSCPDPRREREARIWACLINPDKTTSTKNICRRSVRALRSNDARVDVPAVWLSANCRAALWSVGAERQIAASADRLARCRTARFPAADFDPRGFQKGDQVLFVTSSHAESVNKLVLKRIYRVPLPSKSPRRSCGHLSHSGQERHSGWRHCHRAYRAL
jgi:hypothetical protein